MRSFFAILFLCVNIYQPFSHYLVFIFNILFYLSLSFKGEYSIKLEIKNYYKYPLIILFISLFSLFTTRESHFDYPVIGTSLLTLANIITFPRILYYLIIHDTRLFKLLSFAFFLHCIMIFLQIIIPGLQELTGPVFGFTREDEDLGDILWRKLGLTGGFDQSGLYSAISTLFGFSLYLYTSNRMYLLVFFVSILSSLFTSRTGMASSCLMSILFLILNFKLFKERRNRATWVFLLLMIGIFVSYYIYPFIMSTLGLSNNSRFVDTSDMYSERTSDYLFEFHLIPLYHLNIKEFLFGYGCRVSQVKSLYFGSDIGYVKQIYEIGVVGIFIVLIFCYKWFLFFKQAYRRNKKSLMCRYFALITLFLCALYSFMHYKNYFIWGGSVFTPFLITVISFYIYHKYKPSISLNDI